MYHGNMSKAAQACGVRRQYLYEYVNKNDLWPIVEECREVILDDLEEKGFEVAMRGNVSMLQFMLKNPGRKRGYGDRIDQNTTGEQTIRVIYERSEPVPAAPDTEED